MKILTANIAFGLRNMDRLVPNVRSHIAVHGWGTLTYHVAPFLRGRTPAPSESSRSTYIRSHEDLEPLFRLVARLEPDILVLNEVIQEMFGARIVDFLREQGFESFAWGIGGHYPEAHISALAASRETGESIPHMLPQRPAMGGGAGMAVLRLPGLSVLGVHFSIGVPALWQKQLDAAVDAAREERARGNEVIIAGDWNHDSSFILGHKRFAELGLVCADTAETPTCPTFLPPLLKTFDHIFVPKKWASNSAQVLNFGSDHLAVFADVEPKR